MEVFKKILIDSIKFYMDMDMEQRNALNLTERLIAKKFT